MKSSWVLLIIGLFYTSTSHLFAQDPIFTQFQASQIYINPANTGSDGKLTLTAQIKEQWGAISNFKQFPGAFSTQFASVEFAGSKLKNAIGFFFLRNSEGDADLETQIAGFNYAYVIPFESRHNLHNIRLGLGVHYNQKSIDWDALLFSDQLDNRGPEYFAAQSAHAAYFAQYMINTPKWVELNPGILYRFNEKGHRGTGAQFELGLSFSHLLTLYERSFAESLQGIARESRSRVSLHGSAFFPALQLGNKGKRFTPIPAFRFERQAEINTFTLGSRFMFMNMGMSLFYQNTLASSISFSTDAIVIGADVSWSVARGQYMEAGVSYDLNLNGLNPTSGGSLEVYVKYHYEDKKNKVVCPSVNKAHSERYENIWHKTTNRKYMNRK